MKIGLIREGKTPPDKRVALTPQQCELLQERYPELQIVVQPSKIRAFEDAEYQKYGIELSDDMHSCDVLMGVKEVPIRELIPDKTYFFFSHTYKKQPYNRELLKAILSKNIRLIDYEMLKARNGKRLLGFGRYAGIVGCYNAFRAYGELKGTFHLLPAHKCHDRRELEAELVKVRLPKNFKIAISGAGRVAGGAMEILSALRITQVLPDEYRDMQFEEPVFTQLSVTDYYRHKEGKEFSRYDFFENPSEYQSDFMQFARCTDLYIPCHFWSEDSPYIFTREDARRNDFRIELISDVSCDINGPIASTLRSSTIEDPFYGYDPARETEVPFGAENSIGVSAVDNLPCELPRDASEDFGNELIKNIFPQFFNEDKGDILEKATETYFNGRLMPAFAYLQQYVEGKE